MRFYLGTHHPNWLGEVAVPLFVSRNRLHQRKSFPQALAPWALDSGAFSEVSKYGEWRTTILQYVAETKHYKDAIGNMEWAAQQDWMCEPFILAKTGLDIQTHQWLTTKNYMGLVEAAPEIKWLPVLQGWTSDDYLRHLDEFEKRGVDPAKTEFGVGSICRRQGTQDAIEILWRLKRQRGVSIHAFGLKKQGLVNVADLIVSCDSMAWSFEARRKQKRLCPGDGAHKNCANCLWYALKWRDELLCQLT